MKPLSSMRLRVFVLAVVFGSVAQTWAAGPRTVVSLDEGWRFKAGEFPDASSPIFDDSHWSSVTVPHMFPLVAGAGSPSIYRGEAWYRKILTPTPEWKGKRVFLRFEGVSLICDVYLNGEKLGEHRGGFAAFSYELTGKLHLGQPNMLAVRVDDRLNQDVAPIELSLLYGGIYRNVSLLVTGPIDITPLDNASPGVFLTQLGVQPELATVRVLTEINSNLAGASKLSVRVLVIDGAGKPLFKTAVNGTVPPGSIIPVSQTITVPHPHLWNGVDDPYLYKVRVDLVDESNQVLDTVVQPLGLRSIKVDPRKGFLLNGLPRQLHGVCLHQDYGRVGWAVAPAQEREDLDILREMGADSLRLVHYQHSQSALDLYDRTGMIVWSELPLFSTVGASQAFRDNAKQQLTEMIRQNYNHPSIVMWSLFNELSSKYKASGLTVVDELNRLAHKEDPTRYTVGASHGDMLSNEPEIVNIPDLIAQNNYPGWYFGSPQLMGAEIDKANAKSGNHGLAISEYGGGAKVSDHQQGLSKADSQPVAPYGSFQPEEWQALIHEANYEAIRNRPQVWGSFVWLAFDSGGLAAEDGTIHGGNIKGLITQDRKVRKDAYFFYQANWTTKPMAYITSHRDTNRTQPLTQVKVYSNAASVTLTLNGKSYGSQRPNSLHLAVWKSVVLAAGANKIIISTPEGASDEAVWTLYPSPK